MPHAARSCHYRLSSTL